MADAKRDQNNIPTILAVSSSDGTTPVNVYADPTSHRLLTSQSIPITIASGTGAQTINTSGGEVQFAANASSLVVTNPLVTTSSLVLATVNTGDGQMTSVSVVKSNGSFTLIPNTPPAGTTKVDFVVYN